MQTDKTQVDQQKLLRLWKGYISDPALSSKTTFGKYAHDRVMTSGWCWPALYYAGSEAYDLLHKHIHHGFEDGIRRVYGR